MGLKKRYSLGAILAVLLAEASCIKKQASISPQISLASFAVLYPDISINVSSFKGYLKYLHKNIYQLSDYDLSTLNNWKY